MKVPFCAAFLTVCTAFAGGSDLALSPEVIVDHYCAAYRDQGRALNGASMEVDIDAAIPKLKKQGRLHALRRITALGRLTYEMLRFEGDGTVKKDVINNYLKAELEHQNDPKVAVTTENYKFKYKGLAQLDGHDAYLFEVTPKQKREGLYKGDLWIDSHTYLRMQESGYLVKNSSILMKRSQFVRKYELHDGVSVPVRTQSVTETRLVGRVEMTIDYSHFNIDPAQRAVGGEGEDH